MGHDDEPDEYGATRLTKIPGVGKTTEANYSNAGYKTVQDIANATTDDLVNKLGLNLAKAERLQRLANKVLQTETISIQSAADIRKHHESVVQRIPTGSTKLDELMGGGVQTDAMSLFAGPFGTGKTQLCDQLCVNCVLDLHRKAVFIETEPSTFYPERLEAMAINGRSSAINLDEDVFGIRANFIRNPQKLYDAYVMIENELIAARELDVGLIVVDSFTGIFRTAYMGRENFSERSKEFGRHIAKLQTLASRYNLAVVLTGQVYGNPEQYAQGTSRRRFGIDETVYGGALFLHACTIQVSLNQIQGGQKTANIWSAYVFDSPNRPRGSCEFILTGEGVRDA